MPRIVVRGGRPLSGEVTVGGAKNSALKLMAASLLATGVTRIRNVPDISDVAVMAEVLERLGATVHRANHALEIDTTHVDAIEAPYELVAKMRASIVVLGPLLARMGKARVAMPGGCNIGSRKVDIHIRGLEQLGARIDVEHGFIEATADRLTAAHVLLDFPSVGATENLLMAAVLAEGTTVIENAAREPEIQDLIAFLVSMGAKIEGSGTATVTVEGVDEMHPTDHVVVGDRIEAGTFLVAGALTRGPVTVRGFDPHDLEMVLVKLRAAGVSVSTEARAATVELVGPAKPVDIQTLPYPGFPTDMQAQFMALMSLADGNSVITENVFENRFMFADEIARMGADITIDSHHAIVKGVDRLSGAPVICPDLRGGAALVLAGLVADGETVVEGIDHIERGYEDFVTKLAALGADIEQLD